MGLTIGAAEFKAKCLRLLDVVARRHEELIRVCFIRVEDGPHPPPHADWSLSPTRGPTAHPASP